MFLRWIVAIACLANVPPQPAGKSGSVAAFETLRSLVGEWEGTQGDVPVKVTYTLTASGSALMEDVQPANPPAKPADSPAMITMFSVDGDHLIATHYCAAGNQPQMATKAITNPEKKRLAFSLVRVTGLKTPQDWHNVGVVLTLEDREHLTQQWTYLYEGKTGTNVFHYTRRR